MHGSRCNYGAILLPRHNAQAPEVLICPDKDRPMENKDQEHLVYAEQVRAMRGSVRTSAPAQRTLPPQHTSQHSLSRGFPFDLWPG